MPPRNSRVVADKVVRLGLAPDGSGGIGFAGVNLTPNAMLTAFELVRAERVRTHRGVLERAAGSKRLAVLTNNTGSRTFGTDAKYALWNAPLIPAGGFAVEIHVNSAPLGALNHYWIVGSRPAGQTYHILQIIPSQAVTIGMVAFIVSWRDSAGATHTLTSGEFSDAGIPIHLLMIYDANAGTCTLYINGAVSGTPITGLSSTLKPAQDAGVVWSFGVEKETGAAVTAGSAYPAAIDGFTLFSFPGVRASSGSPSLVDTLRAHSFREWPNPGMPIVIAHFDFSETSGSTLYDRSRKRNNATLTGASTATAAVALSYTVGNAVVVFQKANGAKVNVVAAGGQTFYETVKS
jgi:hypothetical protein